MPWLFKIQYAFAVKTVEVPSMGDSITEGAVFELAKNEGDFVELDEIVAVIETDKVKVDIRSPESGVITKFHAQLEDTVEVGKPFYEIDTDKKGSGAPKAAEPAAQEAKKEAAPEIKQEVK